MLQAQYFNLKYFTVRYLQSKDQVRTVREIEYPPANSQSNISIRDHLIKPYQLLPVPNFILLHICFLAISQEG